jgi:hypothetical protein
METIESIRQKFEIKETEFLKIRKSLKTKLIEIHPDRNNGEFKNTNEKDLFNEINVSIDYIDNLGKDNQMVIVDKMTDLVKAVTDLIPRNNEPSLDTKLDTNINTAVSNYKSSLHLPKISITALTGILTFLFAFPGQIKENPTLSRFIDPTSQIFGMIWISLLFYTAVFWLMTSMNEEKTKRRMESLKLDSTQNSIFEDFKSSLSNNFFTKDQLTNFILELNNGRSSINSLMFIVKQVITASVAQNLAEIIISRAKKKSIIETNNTMSLSDGFKITTHNTNS